MNALADIAALLAAEPAFDPLAITAGAGADGVLQNGLSVDRFLIQENNALDLRRRGLSAGLFFAVRTTLAAAQTLTLTPSDAQTDDNTGFTSPATLSHRASAQGPNTIALPTLVIGPGVLVDARNTLKVQYDLQGAERFIRCRFTADLSAGGVDTANIWGLWVFGDDQNNPFAPGLVGSSAVV